MLAGFSLLAVVALFLLPRIPQDPGYHLFADQSDYFSIPNAMNVFSNFLFLWVGIAGCWKLYQGRLTINDLSGYVYYLFFFSLTLISAGSGYYHWAPSNPTLSWDRLAMALAFMSFFSLILSERVSQALADTAFPILIFAGLMSVGYWHWSEANQVGDLRPYILVQFLPLLLIPFILILFPARFTRSSDLWCFFGCYLLAKILEALDHQIYSFLIFISGHSLKHILAGLGCLVYLRHLMLRERIET